MYSDILLKLRTKEEVQKINEEIDLLINSFYSDNPSETEFLLRSKIRLWFAEILREKFKSLDDKKKFLEGLKEEIKKIKILTLVVAFEPTETSIDKFIGFVRRNIGEKIVLEILIDKEILAGAKIIWQGEYRDFSLKGVFDKEMEVKKEELVQLLNLKV